MASFVYIVGTVNWPFIFRFVIPYLIAICYRTVVLVSVEGVIMLAFVLKLIMIAASGLLV